MNGQTHPDISNKECPHLYGQQLLDIPNPNKDTTLPQNFGISLPTDVASHHIGMGTSVFVAHVYHFTTICG
jgi:hypothetical protein